MGAGFITCEVIESIHAQDKVVIASGRDGVGANEKNLIKKVFVERKDMNMKNELNYPTHTIASTSENSKPALEQLQKAFGLVPNIAGVIANSPKLINALVGVFQQVHSSSLTEQEIQIVLLTTPS